MQIQCKFFGDGRLKETWGKNTRIFAILKLSQLIKLIRKQDVNTTD